MATSKKQNSESALLPESIEAITAYLEVYTDVETVYVSEKGEWSFQALEGYEKTMDRSEFIQSK